MRSQPIHAADQQYVFFINNIVAELSIHIASPDSFCCSKGSWNSIDEWNDAIRDQLTILSPQGAVFLRADFVVSSLAGEEQANIIQGIQPWRP